MLQFTVQPAHGGMRVDRFLFAMCGDLPGSVILKAFRKKDVKINGKRSREETLLSQGDEVSVYLPGDKTVSSGTGNADREADGPPGSTGRPSAVSVISFEPVIVYEDITMLITVKPQGMAVQDADPDPSAGSGRGHEDDTGYDTLLQHWWEDHREPLAPGYPALCHRLDRNTGGLLMFAKTQESLDAIGRHIRKHHIRKLYQCVVAGTPEPRAAEIEAWLEKDAARGRVFVHEHAKAGALAIRTKYRVLETDGAISRLLVEIITGRTHQIRAQMARIGHPILGDSKYGSNQVNRRYKVHQQALWACSLTFDFPAEPSLAEIAGKTVEWKEIPWEVVPVRRQDDAEP